MSDATVSKKKQKKRTISKNNSIVSKKLGARLRGRTATQRSKKGSEKVLRRVLGKGFSEGF